ncbi:unnamed protein product [Prorocentrum cordatum]|uniref:Uncharacterized protein n=1 Tax=Prorocentrum cordatum TaxID=2364126 RepID=A0ABN9R3J2_9DINO|nr:unnamed protein product [Polarella glacialis]
MWPPGPACARGVEGATGNPKGRENLLTPPLTSRPGLAGGQLPSRYASWACDGLTTREVQLHCCKVKGRQVCVRRFVDATGGADCNCRSGGLPRAEPPPEAGPPAEAAAGLGVVALSLARTARQGGGRWPPCAASRRGWRVRRFL